ncbi:MAG: PD-(D/E)XK nuclease family protein [Bifidobacteriaceae bacterium]|jgi:putative RecB family exonuclease|nr:PD-(D/E)XK nuclease family protein [Bifidobacteriaceae bacterium]
MPITSLSPSRAADFKRCPLLYRYRVIDRLPEPPSAAAMRGRLVHAVLQELFGLPHRERRQQTAQSLVPDAYQALRQQDGRLDELFLDGSLTEDSFIAEARALIEAYFTLEDPSRLTAAGLELLVEAQLPGGPLLRGYIDRLEIAPASGQLRIADYKTGRIPRPAYQSEALFQLHFYALAVSLTRGRIPHQVLLLYLGSPAKLAAAPTPADLERTQLKIEFIWRDIQQMVEAQDFPARQGPLCPWCSFQAFCPRFGGTLEPFPLDAASEPPQDPPAPQDP